MDIIGIWGDADEKDSNAVQTGNNIAASVGTKSECNMLKCISFNARSIKNKLPDLHYILYSKNYAADLICITETWLNNSVTNAMLDPQNLFNIFRIDRNTSTSGGGVCIFAKRHINAVDVEISPSYHMIECVCIDLFCNRGTKIRLINLYHPGGKLSSDN